MRLLLALLTVASGAESASTPVPEAGASANGSETRRVEGPVAIPGPQVAYHIRNVTMGSLDWRGHMDPRITPVARQGGAVVWAVDKDALRELLTVCQKEKDCKIVQEQKVTVLEGGEGRTEMGEEVHYVAHLERVADGPPNHATRLAFKPEVATLFNGTRLRVSSWRFEKKGLRSRVSIDLDRIASIQTSKYTESVLPAAGKEGETSQGKNRPRPTTLSGVIQIPVVESARVDGEWLIPKEGALVVSLGVSTTKGKFLGEVRHEELVVLSYLPIDVQAEGPPVRTTAAPASRRKVPSAN